MRTRNLAWSLALMLAATAAQAESPTSKDAQVASAARQAWSITDLVLEQDIDPPARQQMLLDGLKALLRQTPGRNVPNLSARVSNLTTPEQFATLLAEVWPATDAASKSEDDKPEYTLYRGLFAWRQSGERVRDAHGYLSPKELKQYEVLTGNRYVGTGIQIRMEPKEKLTQIVIPSPADRLAKRAPGPAI